VVRYTEKAMTTAKIGAILSEQGVLTEDQISVINSNKTDALFGQKAVDLGFISEDVLLSALSQIYQIEVVNLEFLYIQKEVLNLLPTTIAVSCQAISFFATPFLVKVAVTDPGDIISIDKIREALPNRKVLFYLAKKSEILHFLESMKNFSLEYENDPLLFLNKIIFEAVEQKSSDIHFETQEKYIRIRFRIDGVLSTKYQLECKLWEKIRTRLKLISSLDITENRRPQSGHTRIYVGGKTVDLRISTHLGIFGENMVLRIFDLSFGIKSLSELNFSYDDFCWLKNIVSAPHGIFLIVGPTGAGKTTTLYALLKEMDSSNLNIMTLEDPVEYQIEGIRQLDLQDEGILSFADGIKSILRQDPDVILIGEIRDESTAAMAIRASLTGRLVIATLHSASPYEALKRLQDLNLRLSDFLPSLLGCFSQRLVRYKNGNNYQGRFPITEYIAFTDSIKKSLLQDPEYFVLNRSFKESATIAIHEQLTDIDEIKRVLGNEHF